MRLADEAYHIGPSPAAESYLRIDKIVDVARRAGATLVHPGYGFLAENEDFAQACVDAGLTFVGPTPDAIARMGSKTAAREVAIAAGVPVVPGTEAPFADDAPVRGDRGRGRAHRLSARREGRRRRRRQGHARRSRGRRISAAAVRTARSEAKSAFGDAAVYLERRLIGPRHIEIQLLGDHHGTVIPFVERECSIQRRHQKVVEESPSLVLDAATRRGDGGVRGARRAHVGYTNAGTIEFLVDEDEKFYFLEMNTRLQVEHPVTEMVTGVDLVQWQLRIAQGERLTIDPERALTPRAHAIECRIYAEDPDRGFMPSPGLVRALRRAGRAGRSRRSRRRRGLRDPGVLRLDDLQAHRVGRDARGGDRAARPRARRVPRRRRQDDRAVLPVAGSSARVPRGPVRHDVSRSRAGRAAGASRSSTPAPTR